MLKHYKIVLLLFCSMCVWSCHKAPLCDCFESAGSPGEETVTGLDYFEQVYAQDDVNVFISMGSTEQVIIQGGSNLIRNISATVSNNVLTLRNNNICDWLRSYKKSIINVYITMPRVTYITNAGVGSINSIDTITTDTFQVATSNAGDINLNVHSQEIVGHLFGAGDLTLNGYSQEFACTFFAGIGFAYCSNLKTSYTFISNSSTGDCYVNASNLLIAFIYQRGNIYYSGSPTIDATIKGPGQVIKQ
ncbi:MAG: head GIN domain-containing protein [Bacteroidia bacterium]